jgi:hypothetical protein
MNFIADIFSDQDARNLDRLIRVHCRPNMMVFELGSYTGKSSLTILPHVRRMNGRLFCVDWFRGTPGSEGLGAQSYRHFNILDIFLKNIQEAKYDDLVNVLIGKTDSFASVVADGIADIVFIDADHRYSQVRKDIEHWVPKLKPGGLLCGHDFERHLDECPYDQVIEHCEKDVVNGCHYGVILAVSEIFPAVQREGNIWYVTKGIEQRPSPCHSLTAGDEACSQQGYARGRVAPGLAMNEKKRHPDVLEEEFNEKELKALFARLLRSAETSVVEEAYKGYNILYLDQFYGVAQCLGRVDLMQISKEDLEILQKEGKCFPAASLEEAKNRIDRSGFVGTMVPLKGDYKGFNIVQYLNQFYGLARCLGEIDLAQMPVETLKNLKDEKKCFVGKSLMEVEELISGAQGNREEQFSGRPETMVKAEESRDLEEAKGFFKALLAAVPHVAAHASQQLEKLTPAFFSLLRDEIQQNLRGGNHRFARKLKIMQDMLEIMASSQEEKSPGS